MGNEKSDYTLIEGTFYVIGYSPDGDTIQFKPKKPELWSKIVGFKKVEEMVSVRLQGIDAPETHYCYPFGSKKTFSQTTDIGRNAANALMKILGIINPHWSDEKVLSEPAIGQNQQISNKPFVHCIKQKGSTKKINEKHQEHIPGYIVSNSVEKWGRPLVWVFAGTISSDDEDGAPWDENKLVKRVTKSANYRLLRDGLVYPYISSKLSPEFRKKLGDASREAAKEPKCGVWKEDKTISGIKNLTITEIEKEVIFPDLFRKIITKWRDMNKKLYSSNALNNGEKDIIDLKMLFGFSEKKPGPMYNVKADGTLYMTQDVWDAEF